MEKWISHYDLTAIQALVVRKGARAFTKTALESGYEMGLGLTGMLCTIAHLARKDFYKSMTTHRDHRIWQDVYHAFTPVGMAYVKFTLREDGAIVISFKSLEGP